MADNAVRPYISFGIADLEAEFARARDSNDLPALMALRNELSHRRTRPRNQQLNRSIDECLDGDGQPNSSDRGRKSTRPSAGTYKPKTGKASSSPTYSPTAEQEDAISKFSSGETLKINAFAGAGKTSTLQFMAHSTKRQGQYLAFNKSIVREAIDRFPQNVHCATTHQIAFRHCAPHYGRKSKLAGVMNANQVVDILSLGDRLFEGNRSISARSIAHSILVTQRRFCQSGADTLQLAHVPDHRALAGVSEAGRQEFNEEVIHKATLLWERRVNRADEVPLGHDGYLKVWALTRPRFLVDFILLDEAQDTNEVVLNILRDQEAQIVLVGDRHQQIYEWRGAVNAMESVITRHDASLRQSFRFGSTIARAATKVLNKLGETLAIIGNPKVESHFIAHEKATVLSRTNASAFVACVEAIEKNLRPHMVGGVEETKALLRGVVDLKEGRPTPVPEFFGFENWQQVLECVNAGEADDLATFVNLVQLKGERALLWALNRTSALEEGSDLIVSTAHRSKGREWDHVRLSDDFLKTEPGQIDKPLAQIPPEELRLLYVAMTRAKMTLDLPVSIQQFIS